MMVAIVSACHADLPSTHTNTQSSDRSLLSAPKEEITVQPGPATPPVPLTDTSKARPNPSEDANAAAHPELLNGKGLPERKKPRIEKVRGAKATEDMPPVDYGTSSYEGTSLKYISPGSSSGQVGVFAKQQVHLNMEFGSRNEKTVLYAPTLQAPNYCPLEAVTVYRRDWGWFSTERAFGVFNHDGNYWDEYYIINQSFVDSYVRNYPDGNFYYVNTVKDAYPATGWTVYLWNFSTQTWDSKCHYNWSDPVDNYEGWDMHENFIKNTAPITLPTIRSQELQVWRGGTYNYTNVTSTYGVWFGYKQSPYVRYPVWYINTNFNWYSGQSPL